MSLSRALLSWFDSGRTERPWRNRTDPYEIWVSEVMLQQTRAETVERYYERFLGRFPTVENLAAAPVDDVLALWSGLGYYRRARQLHQAAREVVDRGGRVPGSVEELLELPGIGQYTAAAIASIAFGAPVAVLDGNVERVLSRLLAMEENPRTAASRRRLLRVADEELDRGRPGDFNQALMELGSTVCRPRSPDCPACPLSEICRARELGDPSRYPALPKRARPVKEERVAVLVRKGGRLLMSRRGDDARQLAGVWELPWVGGVGDSGDNAAVEALAERYGGVWKLGVAKASVRHSITTRSLLVMACEGEWEPPPTDGVSEANTLAWIEERSLGEVATSSLVGKVLAAVDAN